MWCILKVKKEKETKKQRCDVQNAGSENKKTQSEIKT